MSGTGTMKKPSLVGGVLLTVTVTWALADPAALLASSVYWVVVAGLTLVFVPLTAPMPGLMLTLVAPVTCQVRVLDAPLWIVDGVAVKLVMTGTAAVSGPTTSGKNRKTESGAEGFSNCWVRAPLCGREIRNNSARNRPSLRNTCRFILRLQRKVSQIPSRFVYLWCH